MQLIKVIFLLFLLISVSFHIALAVSCSQPNGGREKGIFTFGIHQLEGYVAGECEDQEPCIKN